jgi:maltose alpha-D-glucosyltransferase/alpha-amylase
MSTYLANRRWFAKDGRSETAQPLYGVTLHQASAVTDGAPAHYQDHFILSEFEVQSTHGPVHYFVPLAVVWTSATSLAQQYGLALLAAGAKQGLLTDAYTVASFAHSMIDALRTAQILNIEDDAGLGQLHFLPEAGLQTIHTPADAPVQWFLGEQSNSSLSIDNKIMLKLVRRVADDINPEAEMTRRLTRVGFTHGAALLGEVVRRRPDGTQASLAVAHQTIVNEGDAWSWTQTFLADQGARAVTNPTDLQSYAVLARSIGLRLAQMHAALTQPTDDPAFTPEVITPADAQAWRDDILAMLSRAHSALADLALDQALTCQRDWLLARSDALKHAVSHQAMALAGSLRIRIHGDFHLGQVLVAKQDAYLIDFEGEPARTPAERRSKNTPLRDVAGLLRSFSYARAAYLSAPTSASAGDSQSAVRQSLCKAFTHHADDAFIDQYCAALGQAQRPWFTPAVLRILLPLAVMEKAAYEVVYEASHRPSWLHIPLAGLIDMATRVLATDLHNA